MSIRQEEHEVRSRESQSSYVFPIYLLLLTFVLYWPALRMFFSLDDLQYLMKAAGFDESPFGLRRLISVRLFFTGAWRLFDGRPWPYHFIGLVLHAANGWIVFLLARRLGLREMAARAASLLFIATPVAFLPLHWISGIQEISMTLFALLAAYFFFRRGYASMAASLAAAFLSLLCKESSSLLLPCLALVMPVPRRRRVIVGIGGLLMALAVLWAVGGFKQRPAGDPYETAFGTNILWNLLTYTAWFVRVWDYFPDKIPEYQTGLAPWGLILPCLLGVASVRFRWIRLPLARASLLFLFLLLPVLPLARHSYLYYLYLPLIPFWLLAGACVERISKRPVAVAILVAFIFYSAMQGIRHRRVEIREDVLAESILRYAETARNAVSSFRSEGSVMQGDLLVMMPSIRQRVDLTAGLSGHAGTERTTFLMAERALLGGDALKLFFPFVKTVTFQSATGETPGWQSKHLFWTYGAGKMIYLGYGEEGRFKLVNSCMAAKEYERAEQEVHAMLDIRPDDPNLLLILGDIAMKQRDEAKLETIIDKLEQLASEEDPPGIAARALNALKQKTVSPSGSPR